MGWESTTDSGGYSDAVIATTHGDHLVGSGNTMTVQMPPMRLQEEGLYPHALLVNMNNFAGVPMAPENNEVAIMVDADGDTAVGAARLFKDPGLSLAADNATDQSAYPSGSNWKVMEELFPGVYLIFLKTLGAWGGPGGAETIAAFFCTFSAQPGPGALPMVQAGIGIPDYTSAAAIAAVASQDVSFQIEITEDADSGDYEVLKAENTGNPGDGVVVTELILFSTGANTELTDAEVRAVGAGDEIITVIPAATAVVASLNAAGKQVRALRSNAASGVPFWLPQNESIEIDLTGTGATAVTLGIAVKYSPFGCELEEP